MVMEKQNIVQKNNVHPLLYLASADEQGKQWVIRQAQQMRREGIACEVDLLNRSLKAQMREADRQLARYVCIIGQNEIEQRQALLKDMQSGKELPIKLIDIVQELQKLAAPR